MTPQPFLLLIMQWLSLQGHRLRLRGLHPDPWTLAKLHAIQSDKHWHACWQCHEHHPPEAIWEPLNLCLDRHDSIHWPAPHDRPFRPHCMLQCVRPEHPVHFCHEQQWLQALHGTSYRRHGCYPGHHLRGAACGAVLKELLARATASSSGSALPSIYLGIHSLLIRLSVYLAIWA